MAKCKYCGSEISRLDKDLCPFCGGRKPLEGLDDSTEDMTKALEGLKDLDVTPKGKSKIVAALLAIFLGLVGGHAIYLGKYKIALFTFIISVITIGGFGTIAFFTFLQNAFAYLIPFFVMEALMIITGIALLTRSDVSDVNGEFLK